jgi:DNA-binding GntR family transcriptional regulator
VSHTGVAEGNDRAATPSAEQRAYQMLRREILNGTYESGERLREEALAAQFGVSRTPVRAALNRLASEGLVEFRRYNGAVVRILPIEEVEQIFQLRTVVEALAAELTALRIPPADIDRLEAMCEAMDRAASVDIPDLTAIAKLNKEFHRRLWAASGNAYVMRVAENLSDLNFVIRSYRRFSRVDLRRSMGHHRELIHAFRARNPAWARSIMISHVEAGRSLIQAELAAARAEEASAVVPRESAAD